jgi:hypothetical protein
VKRTYEQSYGDLFTTKDGLDTLIIVRHLVSIMRPREGWTLSQIINYVEQSLGDAPDVWLVLNALEHLWMRGELRSEAKVFGSNFIERWVRT